jgi:hypothetical protein
MVTERGQSSMRMSGIPGRSSPRRLNLAIQHGHNMFRICLLMWCARLLVYPKRHRAVNCTSCFYMKSGHSTSLPAIPLEADIRFRQFSPLRFPLGISHLLTRVCLSTEKSEGMFATMIIILPSAYTGGQVHVSHSNQKQTFDFSSTSLSSTAVLAWYTDVKHEVKPVTSGYRLASPTTSFTLPQASLVPPSPIHTRLSPICVVF